MAANDLASIGTPRAVAVWLSTNPTPAAANHALDTLIAEHGHAQALRLWCTGIRIADATRRQDPS
jgi:hypothetical protein